MQRIERYGVIALVFLLVTILAVAVWGQRKNQSLLSFLKRDKPAETAKIDATTGATPPADGLGLSQPSHELTQLTPQPGSVTDTTTQLIPIGGPGGNAVTFDQGNQLNPQPKPISGLVPETQARPLGGAGFVETIGPPSVINNAPRSYTVKRGDTLGSIAQRELGSSKRWPEIEALNGVKPERLSVGMVLKLPVGGVSLEPQHLVKQDTARPSAPAPASTSRGSYSVRQGDSLSKIAAAQLGDANRYGEILALNPGLNPQRLNVGQSLRMPSGAKAQTSVDKPKARATSKTSEVARADAPKKARVQ